MSYGLIYAWLTTQKTDTRQNIRFQHILQLLLETVFDKVGTKANARKKTPGSMH
jgi:hypothetical protein